MEILDRSLVSNMKKLTEGALRIAGGDHDHRVEVVIPRELVSVARAFNTMTAQISAQQRELKQLATTDGLTGLLNRRQFDKILNEEIQRAERYHSAVSLILIDVDHFKHFNDTFGHQGGDEALRSTANVMSDVVRAVDIAFRYGGEEFAVILPESDLESAMCTAERIRTAVPNRTHQREQ